MLHRRIIVTILTELIKRKVLFNFVYKSNKVVLNLLVLNLKSSNI